MNITSTAVMITANKTTENGYYEMEYTTEQTTLQRLQVTLFSLPTEEKPEKEHLGYIISEGDTMHCSLRRDLNYAPIFTDFDSFVKTIKTSLTSKK